MDVADLTHPGLIAGGMLAGGALLHASSAGGHQANGEGAHAGHDGGGHANFRNHVAVDHAANGFDPHELLHDFDWGTTRRLASGRVLREWKLDAISSTT